MEEAQARNQAREEIVDAESGSSRGDEQHGCSQEEKTPLAAGARRPSRKQERGGAEEHRIGEGGRLAG